MDKISSLERRMEGEEKEHREDTVRGIVEVQLQHPDNLALRKGEEGDQ